jgi:hypothetical protein
MIGDMCARRWYCARKSDIVFKGLVVWALKSDIVFKGLVVLCSKGLVVCAQGMIGDMCSEK